MLAKALAAARAAEAVGQVSAVYDQLLATQDMAARPHAGTTALLGFLHRYAPRQRHAEVDALWQRALTEVWARPADLALPIARYLACEPTLAAALDSAVLPADLLAALEADALFHALLRATVIPDPRWERLLVSLSDGLLNSALPLLRLGESLALWAWLSERVALPTATVETEPAPQVSALCHAALRGPIDPMVWSVLAIEGEAFSRLVTEPLREAQLVAQWPAARAHDVAVASHYEAAPYPRWQREPLGLPVVLPAAVSRKLATPALRRPRVLVAGCGTGQQLFVAHDSYPGATLTALDVSRPSLAYAQRQCEAAGLRIGQWRCADLLDVDTDDPPYAIAECIGVLHHLREPSAGWRALAARVQPGGLLHAAVYSRRARAPITALREMLLSGGVDPAVLDVPALRRALLAGRYGPLPSSIAHSVDFYSRSGCRDLLLNAREKVYDLPEFVAEAQAAGFDWLALSAPAAVAAAASKRFGKPAASLGVAQWHAFEAEQPHSFGGMFDCWFVRTARA